MYDDLWTAAKGMYKLEPVVADGGEVIIYAPHITEVSVMHPHPIGYHNRDYFLSQMGQVPLSLGAISHLALTSKAQANRIRPDASRTTSVSRSPPACQRTSSGQSICELPRPGHS